MYISLVFFEMQTTHTGHSLVTVTTIIAHVDLITHEMNPKKTAEQHRQLTGFPLKCQEKNLDFRTRDAKNQDHFSTISGLEELC